MQFGGSIKCSEGAFAPGAEDAAASGAGWSAIVLAGTRPEGDPLAAHFGSPMKALVPLLGEPMLAHVVRTLLDCPSIGRVLIVAQEPERLVRGELRWLQDDPRVDCAVSGDGIAESLVDILGTERAPWPVLVTTADHPLLTRDMVEYFLRESGEAGVGVGVVQSEVLLERYPLNRRTWLRFRGGAYTGANLFSVRDATAAAALRPLASAESDRKNQIKLLWRFGPLLALGAMTRSFSLQQTVARGGRRLGIEAKPVCLPFAEAGIDVDRIEDHRLVSEIMAGRGASASAPVKRASRARS